jgi:hypothetical protein
MLWGEHLPVCSSEFLAYETSITWKTRLWNSLVYVYVAVYVWLVKSCQRVTLWAHDSFGMPIRDESPQTVRSDLTYAFLLVVRPNPNPNKMVMPTSAIFSGSHARFAWGLLATCPTHGKSLIKRYKKFHPSSRSLCPVKSSYTLVTQLIPLVTDNFIRLQPRRCQQFTRRRG